MIFRRGRFGGLIARQLDLFERDHGDVIERARERLESYNRAGRGEAEELFGGYVDAIETGAEILAELRDSYSSTLDEDVGEEYRRAFNRAVEKRLPSFALEIDER